MQAEHIVRGIGMPRWLNKMRYERDFTYWTEEMRCGWSSKLDIGE